MQAGARNSAIRVGCAALLMMAAAQADPLWEVSDERQVPLLGSVAEYDPQRGLLVNPRGAGQHLITASETLRLFNTPGQQLAGADGSWAYLSLDSAPGKYLVTSAQTKSFTHDACPDLIAGAALLSGNRHCHHGKIRVMNGQQVTRLLEMPAGYILKDILPNNRYLLQSSAGGQYALGHQIGDGAISVEFTFSAQLPAPVARLAAIPNPIGPYWVYRTNTGYLVYTGGLSPQHVDSSGQPLPGQQCANGLFGASLASVEDDNGARVLKVYLLGPTPQLRQNRALAATDVLHCQANNPGASSYLIRPDNNGDVLERINLDDAQVVYQAQDPQRGNGRIYSTHGGLVVHYADGSFWRIGNAGAAANQSALTLRSNAAALSMEANSPLLLHSVQPGANRNDPAVLLSQTLSHANGQVLGQNVENLPFNWIQDGVNAITAAYEHPSWSNDSRVLQLSLSASPNFPQGAQVLLLQRQGLPTQVLRESPDRMAQVTLRDVGPNSIWATTGSAPTLTLRRWELDGQLSASVPIGNAQALRTLSNDSVLVESTDGNLLSLRNYLGASLRWELMVPSTCRTHALNSVLLVACPQSGSAVLNQVQRVDIASGQSLWSRSIEPLDPTLQFDTRFAHIQDGELVLFSYQSSRFNAARLRSDDGTLLGFSQNTLLLPGSLFLREQTSARPFGLTWHKIWIVQGSGRRRVLLYLDEQRRLIAANLGYSSVALDALTEAYGDLLTDDRPRWFVRASTQKQTTIQARTYDFARLAQPLQFETRLEPIPNNPEAQTLVIIVSNPNPVPALDARVHAPRLQCANLDAHTGTTMFDVPAQGRVEFACRVLLADAQSLPELVLRQPFNSDFAPVTLAINVGPIFAGGFESN